MYINEELQNVIEENASLIEQMVIEIVDKYTFELDKYVRKVEEVLESAEDITDEDLNRIMIRLSTFAYFIGAKSELAAIRKDVSEMTKLGKYNDIYINLTSGTVARKQAEAEVGVQEDTVIFVVYDRVYKILKNKYDSTVRLIDTVKKITTQRMKQMELGAKV